MNGTKTSERDQTGSSANGHSEPSPVTVGALIRPARGGMITSGILTGLGAVMTLVPFLALQQMASIWLGETSREGWTGDPRAWAAIAAGALFAGQLLYFSGLGISHVAEARLRHGLRERVVGVLASMPLGKVAQVPHGAIRKMVCDDTTAIHTLVAHVPGDVTSAAVSFLAGMCVLFVVDWRMALALSGCWALMLAIVAGPAMRGYGNLTERFGDAQTRMAAATVEMIEGIKEIKNFQATDATRTRFSEARTQFSATSFEWARRTGPAISFLGALLRPSTVFVTVALLAALFTSQGWMPLSATLPFFLIAPGIPEGATVVIGMLQHIYESRMAAQTTARLVSEPPMPEGELTGGDGPHPGLVEACDVHFSYEPGVPVLRGVSFTAQPGTVTALVGPSGGGKSTLAALLARFHDVDSGAVRISGVDVRTASSGWLLSRVAIVLQDVALSNDSVFANIALGRPDATQAHVEAAARAACIHERIMRLPEGYQTILGEEGGFLSGGERQRITLARAYLQDAPVLILDEATAQADPQAEHDIHRALSALAAGRTVIVIAHRLATIQDADQILVLDSGLIRERGSHAGLLAAGGRYAALWQAQQLSYAEEREPEEPPCGS